MPLLDHFHPPLYPRRSWQSFLRSWSANIGAELNRSLLPPGLFAEIRGLIGRFDENGEVIPDEIAVIVYEEPVPDSAIGAIELICPSFKTSHQSKGAFDTRCQEYLRAGVGLLKIDIITEIGIYSRDTQALHNDWPRNANGPTLEAISYCPNGNVEAPRLNVYPARLTLGQNLPSMPFFLRKAGMINLDLEATYMTTRKGNRL